ncbi:MAG TPA: oxidoreductase [Steroidobacteraceae bacterium]|nr:oxidoreductase [Steroidobacteraceae bacterium]
MKVDGSDIRGVSIGTMEAIHMLDTCTDSAVWFITGCSSGLGFALGRLLLEQKQRVVLTARDTHVISRLAAANVDTALALQLDVTDQPQIDDAVELTMQRYGRIDVLVNNAGYAYLAAIEEGECAEVRRMFDVNVFGLVAVTQSVLPAMRARGKGHIINVGSMAGMIGRAGGGYYSATKFALEGLSQALAREVEPLGIKVTVVEPGPFRTEFSGRSLRITRTPIGAYAGTAGARRKQTVHSHGKQPGDPERFARTIFQLAQLPAPPSNVVLGTAALSIVQDSLSHLSAELCRWSKYSGNTDFAAPCSPTTSIVAVAKSAG